VLYQMVMSGEITTLMPGSALLPHAMRINSIAINVGLVCAYGFMVWFLAIPRHYPRLTWVFVALLAACLLALAGALVDPANGLFLAINNLATMTLAALTLVVGVARARAGSPQGWFYLVGWGSLSMVGLYRAGLFLNQRGTPDWLEVAHPTFNAFGALVLVLATARAARYAEREMHAAREVARTDPLTGLPNRSQLDRGLAALLESCRSTGQPLSLVFLDLDHFKSINDRFGHRVGDACLAASAQILKSQVRTTDLLARYGGEEFILVLPGASPQHAGEIAEAARAAIERQARSIDGCPVALTVSIGIAAWRAGEPVADLIARADAALYRAKDEGRNRVVDAERSEAPKPALATGAA
jgi:diguanylate cyclase (GGDEF)-like protein